MRGAMLKRISASMIDEARTVERSEALFLYA
ncbi:MAG: hypothetical protein AMDU1_APLC00096G0004 [Thermoplasmatales archaeon A-plasma]|jgi:hypothetical protein|nr:MAG: hypothetical protein AMDU1_APLC00096G0004 [Thermoplasmatales archaeon A-plasma]